MKVFENSEENEKDDKHLLNQSVASFGSMNLASPMELLDEQQQQDNAFGDDVFDRLDNTGKETSDVRSGDTNDQQNAEGGADMLSNRTGPVLQASGRSIPSSKSREGDASAIREDQRDRDRKFSKDFDSPHTSNPGILASPRRRGSLIAGLRAGNDRPSLMLGQGRALSDKSLMIEKFNLETGSGHRMKAGSSAHTRGSLQNPPGDLVLPGSPVNQADDSAASGGNTGAMARLGGLFGRLRKEKLKDDDVEGNNGLEAAVPNVSGDYFAHPFAQKPSSGATDPNTTPRNDSGTLQDKDQADVIGADATPGGHGGDEDLMQPGQPSHEGESSQVRPSSPRKHRHHHHSESGTRRSRAPGMDKERRTRRMEESLNRDADPQMAGRKSNEAAAGTGRVDRKYRKKGVDHTKPDRKPGNNRSSDTDDRRKNRPRTKDSRTRAEREKERSNHKDQSESAGGETSVVKADSADMGQVIHHTPDVDQKDRREGQSASNHSRSSRHSEFTARSTKATLELKGNLDAPTTKGRVMEKSLSDRILIKSGGAPLSPSRSDHDKGGSVASPGRTRRSERAKLAAMNSPKREDNRNDTSKLDDLDGSGRGLRRRTTASPRRRSPRKAYTPKISQDVAGFMAGGDLELTEDKDTGKKETPEESSVDADTIEEITKSAQQVPTAGNDESKSRTDADVEGVGGTDPGNGGQEIDKKARTSPSSPKVSPRSRREKVSSASPGGRSPRSKKNQLPKASVAGKRESRGKGPPRAPEYSGARRRGASRSRRVDSIATANVMTWQRNLPMSRPPRPTSGQRPKRRMSLGRPTSTQTTADVRPQISTQLAIALADTDRDVAEDIKNVAVANSNEKMETTPNEVESKIAQSDDSKIFASETIAIGDANASAENSLETPSIHTKDVILTVEEVPSVYIRPITSDADKHKPVDQSPTDENSLAPTPSSTITLPSTSGESEKKDAEERRDDSTLRENAADDEPPLIESITNENINTPDGALNRLADEYTRLSLQLADSKLRLSESQLLVDQLRADILDLKERLMVLEQMNDG